MQEQKQLVSNSSRVVRKITDFDHKIHELFRLVASVFIEDKTNELRNITRYIVELDRYLDGIVYERDVFRQCNDLKRSVFRSHMETLSTNKLITRCEDTGIRYVYNHEQERVQREQQTKYLKRDGNRPKIIQVCVIDLMKRVEQLISETESLLAKQSDIMNTLVYHCPNEKCYLHNTMYSLETLLTSGIQDPILGFVCLSPGCAIRMGGTKEFRRVALKEKAITLVSSTVVDQLPRVKELYETCKRLQLENLQQKNREAETEEDEQEKKNKKRPPLDQLFAKYGIILDGTNGTIPAAAMTEPENEEEKEKGKKKRGRKATTKKKKKAKGRKLLKGETLETTTTATATTVNSDTAIHVDIMTTVAAVDVSSSSSMMISPPLPVSDGGSGGVEDRLPRQYVRVNGEQVAMNDLTEELVNQMTNDELAEYARLSNVQ